MYKHQRCEGRLMFLSSGADQENDNSCSTLKILIYLLTAIGLSDRLCGLVVRVSGYRYRGLGFDSRRYQIF